MLTSNGFAIDAQKATLFNLITKPISKHAAHAVIPVTAAVFSPGSSVLHHHYLLMYKNKWGQFTRCSVETLVSFSGADDLISWVSEVGLFSS